MKLINLFLFILLISINCSFADINKEFENWKLKIEPYTAQLCSD